MPTWTVLLWQGFFVALFALILISLWSAFRNTFHVPDITPGQLEQMYQSGDIDINRYMALKERVRRKG